VNEVHEVSGLVILVIDLIAGGELLGYMKNVDKIQDREVWTIMTQLAQSLDDLNSLNIVHRDIKPQNVLFKYPNKPILENELCICVFFNKNSIV
jgi:serine/threonine protein kinase